MSKPRIVLFSPSPYPGSKYYGLPLSLLAIATLPHAAGFPVTIVAEDVDPDPVDLVLEACEGALLFGVTSLTGGMIWHGLEMCAKVRERYPDLPIVWGGTHPSIAPEQTIAHPLVDIVVRGQGEAAFMDLVEALYNGRPLESVGSLHFKRDGEVIETPARPTIDIDTLPPLPFELLDMERYIAGHSSQLRNRFAGRRSVTYYSSYGCPFSCHFCSEPLTSNRRWYSKSPEKTVDEIATLKNEYGADLIVIEDPIYFVDVRRVRRISELLVERGVDVWWSATSRLETIRKIDQPTWDLLKRSGFQQVFIGIESASPTVLKSIGKKYTADDIVEAARILDEQEVLLVASYIQGLPVKEKDRPFEEVLEEDMRLAAQTILRTYEVNPTASIAVLMYTPYPGSAAYDLSIELGFRPPETLEEFRNFSHYTNQVPWMLPEQETFARTSVLAQAALKGKMGTRSVRRNRPIRKAIIKAYTAATRHRYRTGNFKYPLDQRAMISIVHLTTKKKGERQKEGMLI
jgi:radical SAM superfamily enzyme YgiQ (UPF0313 family)